MRVVIGSSDVTALLVSKTWSGSKSQAAREMNLEMAVSDTDTNLPVVDCPIWSAVSAYDDDGTRIFLGTIAYRGRASGSRTMTLRCLDRARSFAKNEDWQSFDCTPEAAVSALCGKWGVTMGSVAKTGVTVARKFAGVALHKIIDTMYTKASDTTGKKYMLRFDGDGVLHVITKPTAASIVLAPKVNIISSSIAEDGTDYRNSVAIYSETGALIRTIGDEDAIKLAGLMQAAIIQRDGEDATDEANTLLEDSDIQQTVTVECLGDTRLITGEAVIVRETASGVAGLFWIDGDTHTWKNGQYTSKLTLNFRNLMNETEAGTEVDT